MFSGLQSVIVRDNQQIRLNALLHPEMNAPTHELPGDCMPEDIRRNIGIRPVDADYAATVNISHDVIIGYSPLNIHACGLVVLAGRTRKN